MNRFLLGLAMVSAIYGSFEYGRSEGSMKVRFDRPPRYPTVTPVINECKDSITYDGYQRVAPRKIRKCSQWSYQYDGYGRVQNAVCMDDLSIAWPQ